MATTAAIPRAKKLPTLLSRRRRGGLDGGDRAAGHEHFLEPLGVHVRRDLGGLEEALPALVDGDDAADAEALGEDAVHPGADQRVAHLYVLGPLHVVEHAAGVHGALHDATSA